ncbi:uncharacterized protein PV07_10545 [Cladophialophora immunda]|uniref:Uncharacterized protein n=1 Tax=Cladophialophora immunda TaxID=569365 RepID=A0A0D2AIX3_9EURO|nr:uncharacterized protein PV07_10545 [Cladophialophora immunda]KIW24857.1 hypothetical protein PV07_10545 [Cladophialophora immunda]
MTIEVYADELLRLTVKDIGDEVLIEIKDPENQTEKHLAHLRELIDKRFEKDCSRAVNADELGDRLGRLPSRKSTPSSRSRSLSVTPSFTEEEIRKMTWIGEEESYCALKADGGRPSHPIDLGFDVLYNPGEYQDIIKFWQSFGGCGFLSVFSCQLGHWRQFREFQDRMREFYNPRNRFQEYQNIIRESQADAGCKWGLPVLEDRHQQNRLEDWNEFRAFCYRRLKAYRKRIEPAERELLHYQKKLEEVEAQTRLTDVITDPQVLYSRLHEITASEKEVADAKSRVESAENGLKAAKRNNSKRKASLIRAAYQKLRSARDCLIHVSSSEEMRRLRDGYDLHIAQEVMAHAEGGLRAAQLNVKRWEAFVKWIDDQYPVIAAECGYLHNDSGNNVTQGFGVNGRKQTPRARTHRRKDAETKSVLSPNSSSRISKSSKRKPDRTRQVRRAQILSPSTIQQLPVERPILPRRSERLQQSKDHQTRQVPNMNVLHSVRSAKVTKVSKRDVTPGQQSTQRDRSIAKRSPGTKQTATSGNRTLRRSQRLAQQSGHCGYK